MSITITVVPTVRARRMGEMRARLTRWPWPLSAGTALAAVITLVAVAAYVVRSGPTNSVTRPAAATQQAASAAVARAFGYPQRCLSVAVSATDPAYASAHVDRTGACANYRGYVNASFHRVDGAWRLVLDEGQLFVPNALLSPGSERSARARGMGGYAFGCVSVGVAFHDPRFGRAGFDRGLPCVRNVR